jgi:hypothetical protein
LAARYAVPAIYSTVAVRAALTEFLRLVAHDLEQQVTAFI